MSFGRGRWSMAGTRGGDPAFTLTDPPSTRCGRGAGRDVVHAAGIRPYTAWHLSYVALGAAAGPGQSHLDRLLARPRRVLPGGWHPPRTHSNELKRAGRWATHISERWRWWPWRFVGLLGAVGNRPSPAPWTVFGRRFAYPSWAVGSFLVVAYNPGAVSAGRFSTATNGFAAAWERVFPALTGYWVQTRCRSTLAGGFSVAAGLLGR